MPPPHRGRGHIMPRGTERGACRYSTLIQLGCSISAISAQLGHQIGVGGVVLVGLLQGQVLLHRPEALGDAVGVAVPGHHVKVEPVGLPVGPDLAGELRRPLPLPPPRPAPGPGPAAPPCPPSAPGHTRRWPDCPPAGGPAGRRPPKTVLTAAPPPFRSLFWSKTSVRSRRPAGGIPPPVPGSPGGPAPPAARPGPSPGPADCPPALARR